jgi:hypothetical protein
MQIWERLERRSRALIDLRAGLRGQSGALLDQRQRRLRLQLARAQHLGRLVQPSTQLDHGISHGPKLIDPALAELYISVTWS